MASPAFTEQITFLRYPTVSDGAGGKKNSGSAVNLGVYFANIVEKSYSRLTDAEKLTFRNMYTVKIWKNPTYEPKEGDVVEYRGKNLVIQEISESGDYRYYMFKMVAKR